MKSQLWWKWLIVAGLVLCSLWLALPAGEKIRLGLDLSGGYSCTVQLDREELEKEIRERNAGKPVTEKDVQDQIEEAVAAAGETAVEIVRSRIDTLGTEEPVITKSQDGRIYVQIPKASPEQYAKVEKIIRSVAKLEFKLVHPQSDALAGKLLAAGKAPRGFVLSGKKDGFVQAPEAKAKGQPLPDPRAYRTFGTPPAGFVFALERDDSDPDLYHPIYVDRRHRMTGDAVRRADVGRDDMTGKIEVLLSFGTEGTEQFAKLTTANVGRRLAIVLDGVVYSAPVLREAITGGRASISGSFTQEEAATLRNVLNAGAMPAPLKFMGSSFVDPTLGRDSIADAKVAIFVGSVGVLLFMFFYYRRIGLVADLALLLNFVLLPVFAVVASGLLSQVSPETATAGGSALRLPVLTLPGIAGILLTVGMAVDANVLIYERVREEVRNKRPAYPSLMAGYDRAFSAIFDGNITTIVTGVILFVVGTGLIRGFAVTLIAGIVASMFTALFVTKIFFQSTVREDSNWKIGMLQAVRDDIDIQFVKNWKRFAVPACAVIVLTLAVTVIRGVKDPTSVFALDFTGGTKITYAVSPKSAAAAPAAETPVAAPVAAPEAKADEVKAEESKPEEVKADETKPEETKADETKAEESKTDEVKADETKPEEIKTDDGAEPEKTEPAVSLADVKSAGPAAAPELPSMEAIRKALLAAGISDAEPQYQYATKDGRNVATLTVMTTLSQIERDGAKVDVQEAAAAALANAGDAELSKASFTSENVEQIGSQIGREMKRTAFWAILLATVAMLVYIGFRFEFGFGVGAIVALFHDVLVTMGVFSCLGFQFNLTIVAALLTIVGYGVNDTIVLFDRVREEIRRDQKTDFPVLVNRCVNRTLSRTVLTSVTTLIPVVSLVVFCHGDIRGFGVCVLIGVIVSTLSSIFVASPVMLAWYRGRRPDLRKAN